MGSSCTKAGREEAAFLKAAKDGDCRVVQQAILRNVEWACKVQTWNGQSVLHLAARHGRLGVLETVIEAVRFNPAGPDKWSKLLRLGHSTDAILRSFANLQDARCQTPLHLACIYGHHEAAERLLQLGATPWAWDELGGRTPLHYAASMGHVDVIRVIIAHNTPAPTGDALRRPNSSRTRLVDICNDSGYTPLHYAVWAGNAASVRALTSYEASLSARNVACGSDWVVSCLKCTPLHLAAHKGNLIIVKLLLSAYVQYQPPQGTNTPPVTDRRRRDPRRHVNANRQLPYHVAVSRHHTNLAEILHPDVPFSFVLNPDEMESRLYGVPKLAVLASKSLQGKLVAEIESAVAAMATAVTARGPAVMSSGGRTRSGALAALSGPVGPAGTGQAAAGGGASASATAQQVLAAATARLRSVTERSLGPGSAAALQALEGAVQQASSPSLPSTQQQQRRASTDRGPNGNTAAALAPVVVHGPVVTACGGASAASNAVVNSGAAGKTASLPSSNKSSAASGVDSEKDALALNPVPDFGSRAAPRPHPEDAGPESQQPAQPLPLPPAPISPFLPATSAAAATAPSAAGAAGAGPAMAGVPTFNEAASAFALFAAEPFDDPAAVGGGGRGGGGGGGQELTDTSSASINLAVLARSRANQAAGGVGGTGVGLELQPSGNTSVSIAVLARSRVVGAPGNGGAGGGSVKLASSRTRSLRSLLTVGKIRRSITNFGSGGGVATGLQQQQRSEIPPADAGGLGTDDDQADDLDDILSAMQPPEGGDGVEAVVAAAAAAAPNDADGAAAPGSSHPSGFQVSLSRAPSRGRGASNGGGRPFWRRSSTTAAPAASVAGDGTSHSHATLDGGSPYTGSLHAGLAASAALAAATIAAASTAPPGTLPLADASVACSRAPSLAAALPPGVIESPLPTEAPDLDAAIAAMKTSHRHWPTSVGVTPFDSVDDNSTYPRAPSSAIGGLRRSSISLAQLARGGAEAALPPPDLEHVDGALLAMLASLVEAPQHVLRRYRLLQLTHGLDLEDLLRDHSEQAAAAGAALTVATAAVAAGGGNGTPRASGIEGSVLLPARSNAAALTLAPALPALRPNTSLRASAGELAPAAPAAITASTVLSNGGVLADVASGVSPGPAIATVTSPFAQEAAAPEPPATRPSANGMAAGGAAPLPPSCANPSPAAANLAGQLLRTLSSAAASESGEGTCGVCFDQPDVLAISGCGHRLCTDCSRELCKLNTLKPALCPFCRGMIGGFRYVGRRG